jgi:hypothetical protein
MPETMKRTDILEGLGSKYELPVDELLAARQELDALAPTFLDLLDRIGEGEHLSDEDSQRVFFGVHLLGEAGDTRLYRPLIRLLGENPEAAQYEFGDAIVDTVPGILINVADTDPEPLLALARRTDIEYPLGDVIRSVAVGAYAYLVACGRFDSDQAESHLAAIGEAFESDIDMSSAHAWITAAVALGFSDLIERARKAMRDDPAGAPIFTVQELDQMVEDAKPLPAEAVIANEGFRPFGDVIATLSNWHAFSAEGVQQRQDAARGELPETGEDWELDDDPFLGEIDDPDAPFFIEETDERSPTPSEVEPFRSVPEANPYRHVGRNDLCPCGSGKKYKKCCLR